MGQTRYEHDSHLAMFEQPFADGFLSTPTTTSGTTSNTTLSGPTKLNKTKVYFCLNGQRRPPPPLEAPFYPPVRNKYGKMLMELINHTQKQQPGEVALVGDSSSGYSGGDDSNNKAVIVHESCALQMFKARIDRNRLVKYSIKTLAS